MHEDIMSLLAVHQGERRFHFAINDLADLIESNEIDFHLVVSTLRRSLHKPDPLLEEAWSVVSSVDTEANYYGR
jgi:hypothetical protein